MEITTHKAYDKAWAKLNNKQRQRVLQALKIFITRPASPQLRLHQLEGSYYPQYSISAGGDLRVHFAKIDEHKIVLMLIGTHSQLY